MATLNIRYVDINNSEDILQLERAMYQAFNKYPVDSFDGIWEFDHDLKRTRTLVPYTGQKILAAVLNNQIIGASLMNLDMAVETQLEKIGFTFNKEQGKTAEGLALFSNKTFVGRKLVLLDLMEQTNKVLQALDIHSCFISCDKKHLYAYQQVGFSMMDKVSFNGQDEFLLRHTFNHAAANLNV